MISHPCPTCGHDVLEEDESNNFDGSITGYFICDNCDCEFEVLETTSRREIITKKGNPQ